jgi:hypothetical protein
VWQRPLRLPSDGSQLRGRSASDGPCVDGRCGRNLIRTFQPLTVDRRATPSRCAGPHRLRSSTKNPELQAACASSLPDRNSTRGETIHGPVPRGKRYFGRGWIVAIFDSPRWSRPQRAAFSGRARTDAENNDRGPEPKPSDHFDQGGHGRKQYVNSSDSEGGDCPVQMLDAALHVVDLLRS